MKIDQLIVNWFFAWSYSKVLKLNGMVVFKKILFWDFCAKNGLNGLKISFFKFYGKVMLRIFLGFVA